MPLRLDGRLRSIAALVLPGGCAADIGTDHGLLPVYVVEEGLCAQAIAADKNAGPLEAARSLVENRGLAARVSLRLGDGLSVLRPGEADTIILAGMGGMLIRSLLEREPAVAAGARRLVLQPQTDADLVRYYLRDQGWRIVGEDLVQEGNQFYQVIAAEAGRMELTAGQARFGPLILSQPHPLAAEWLEWHLRLNAAVAAKLPGASGSRAAGRWEALRADRDLLERLLREVKG